MSVTAATARLPGLTLIRFLAAFYVFAFHFQSRFKLNLPHALASVIDNGPIAMPIFFMLSGFVLHFKYALKYDSFKHFYEARIARIYPTYLLCVLLCLPLILRVNSLTHINYIIPLAALLLISALLLQAWYPNLFPYSHIAGTWSVSVEMFLYATYPITRRIAVLTPRQCVYVIFGCTLFGGSVAPSLLLPFSERMPLAVFYCIPFYHLPEFIIGVTIAALYLRGVAKTSAWAGAGLILLLALALFGKYNTRYMDLNLILLPLTAALIFGFACADRSRIGFVRSIVTNRVSIYLGEISYSFFLMQIPMMLYIDSHPDITHLASGTVAFFILLCINLIVAAFTFRFVEKPGQRLLLDVFRRNESRQIYKITVKSMIKPSALD